MKHFLTLLTFFHFWLAVSAVSVTFRVDMSEQIVDPAGVHLAGSFGSAGYPDWNPAGIALADAGAGIWEVTLVLNQGEIHEYKFINGTVWGQDEGFIPAPCGTAGGNRIITVGGFDETLSLHCFGACSTCTPPQHTVTFSVDMSNEVVDPAGVHIAGSFQGWDPAGTPLVDMGGGVWSYSTLIEEGSSLEYKFINGNQWGQDEVVPFPCEFFGNRTWTVGSVDESIPLHCFSSCEPCAAPPAQVDITFRVDMSLQVVSGAGVHLVGGFGSAGYPEWDPAGIPMTDTGGNIWEVTLTLQEGTNYAFKYLNGNTFTDTELVPEGCGQDDGFGGFNRSFTASAVNETVPTVCFGTCAACTFVNYNITFSVDMTGSTIDPAGVHLAGSFNGFDPSVHPITDLGNGIWQVVVPIQSGQTIEYVFVNGANLVQSESVDPLCANQNGNRSYFVTANEATLGPVCFNLCGACPENLVDVTFQVDMSEVATNPIGVFIVGSFQSPTPWTPGADLMTNVGGDVWQYTIALEPGTTVEYKYLNGPNWANEESVPGGCGVSNGQGGFNRTHTVGNAAELIDLHCFSSCNPCATPLVNVTLQVDMSNEVVDAAGVHIAGNFQGWDPSATLMVDQGNGIWTYTAQFLPNDLLEYKFVNGNAWGQDEVVPAGCNFSGNRQWVVGNADESAGLVCFGSCVICSPPQHLVTFSVDMSNEVVDAAGVHIAGNFQGWDPSTTPMVDQGNGIWEYAVLLDEGSSLEYKYVNGNAWGLDELVPAPCEFFGNRTWVVGSSDETIPLHCFASCDPCIPPAMPVNVTFRVDLSQQVVDPSGVHLAGDFQGWDPSATPLTDMGNGIWELTLLLDANTAFEYKFINGTAFGQDESVPGECQVNGNRQVTTFEEDLILPVVCFGLCQPCLIDVTFSVDMFNQTVSASGVHIAGDFQGWDPAATQMEYIGYGIWRVSLQLERFSYYEWKFINGNSWGDDEDVPVECQTNWNRFITTGGESFDLDLVCFGSCTLCEGCTDPFSLEFNPFAEGDNGSCATPVVWGCIYPDASNYNSNANTDNGSCLFEAVSACPADLNDDGLINTGDLVELLGQFGTSCN